MRMEQELWTAKFAKESRKITKELQIEARPSPEACSPPKIFRDSPQMPARETRAADAWCACAPLSCRRHA
jgi:hypothetical protein